MSPQHIFTGGVILWLTVILSPEAYPDTDSLLHTILPDTCLFTGDFSQKKQLKGLPAPLTSSGNFLFFCDHGLIWNSLSPFSETLIYTDNNIHYQFDSGGLHALAGNSHRALAKILIGLMESDHRYIEKNFNIASKSNRNSENIIQLTPKKKFLKKAISHITLESAFNKNKLLFSIHQHTNESTEIVISNVNKIISADKTDVNQFCTEFFSFNQKPCDALRHPHRYQNR
ncbi:MAG: outer membrane lipoprotein carrier protein LolA [Cellvibrionaceae bacterium]|nr:outer membrane lipoprotein carrier protein LolA [Cellvibrionaceae bacterium]